MAMQPQSNRRRRHLRVCARSAPIALVAAALLALAACSAGPSSSTSSSGNSTSGNWNSVIAQAKQEGQVIFYAGLPSAQLNSMADAFQRTYGINVKLVELSTVPTIQAIENGAKAHQKIADVVDFGDPATLAQFIKQGNIIDATPDVPSASLWPSKYFSNGTVVPEVHAVAMAYNTNLIPASQAPKTWQDLLNPKWKNEIGLFDPSSVDAAQGLQALENDYGAGFIKALGAQNLKDYASGTDEAAALTSGEIKIAIGILNILQLLVNQGAPVAIPPGLDGQGFDTVTFVAQSAPHPAAARLFLNFIMSTEGQLSFLGDDSGISPINLPGTIPLPKNFTMANPVQTANNLNTLRSMLNLPPLPNS
jgi:iron(III) transport system substrate-binding protein